MKNSSKKAIIIAVLAAVFVISAAEGALAQSRTRKLGRGVANVVSCPLEIPYQMINTFENDGGMAAWTLGLLKGAGMTVVRAGVGVFEVCTFFIEIPEDFRPVLRYPEFFLGQEDFRAYNVILE
ncbi:exosortase system-associated protein, TIGR04073 family [Candidatus Omnitrophota bacterium]